MMKVELLDILGSDVDVCNAARVSYGKLSDKFSDEQNSKLINFLAKHGHWSPFSHCILKFRIQCPIYVERQLFKHQSGVTVNSISGRYVDFSDTYTIIDDGNWRKQSKSSKQGSDGLIENQKLAGFIQSDVIEVCKTAYSDLIDLGVSKEQARTILPLCLNTEFIWTGSLFALIRICGLRLKPDAQKETRDVVQEMLNLTIKSEKFNESLKAYGLFGDKNEQVDNKTI